VRWVGLILLVLLLVAAVPVVYLWLFPPFDLPDTGHLETTVTRDVDLQPGRAAVVRLEVDHDPRIFRDSSAEFPPTLMRAALTTLDGSPGPMQLRILSADPAWAVDGLEPRIGSTNWVIPCEDRTPGTTSGGACSRSYFAVISAPEMTDDARVRLAVDAELPFPPNVPTPFLVRIGLDASEPAVVDDALTLHTAEFEDSIAISAEHPVAWQLLTLSTDVSPAQLDDGEAIAGMLLRVDVDRQGDAVPTGFDAPPPVRLAVLDADGGILADLDLRPTGPAQIALPVLGCPSLPCEEEYRLVAQWRDRADQAYEIQWAVEAATVAGADEVMLMANGGRTEQPEPLASGAAEGTADNGADQGGGFAFPLEIDPGSGVGERHLAPTAGVLRLELVLPEGEGSQTIYLNADNGGRGGGLPLALHPGDRSDAVVDALAGCEGSCFAWTASPALELAPDGSRAEVRLTFGWRASVTLWPLDPFADPSPTVSER
jgi:hypothetical protein